MPTGNPEPPTDKRAEVNGISYTLRGKAKHPKTPAQIQARLEKKEKTEKALKLRAAGWTYEQIDKALGMGGRGRAYKLIRDALDELMVEPTEELLNLELFRLEEIQKLLWHDMMSTDDTDKRLRIVNTIYNGMDRRHKLLRVGDVLNGNSPTAQINAQINVDARQISQGTGQPAVLIIEGNSPQYIKQLELASGQKAPELSFKDVTMKIEESDVSDGIIDAEVVE